MSTFQSMYQALIARIRQENNSIMSLLNGRDPMQPSPTPFETCDVQVPLGGDHTKYFTASGKKIRVTHSPKDDPVLESLWIKANIIDCLYRQGGQCVDTIPWDAFMAKPATPHLLHWVWFRKGDWKVPEKVFNRLDTWFQMNEAGDVEFHLWSNLQDVTDVDDFLSLLSPAQKERFLSRTRVHLLSDTLAVVRESHVKSDATIRFDIDAFASLIQNPEHDNNYALFFLLVDLLRIFIVMRHPGFYADFNDCICLFPLKWLLASGKVQTVFLMDHEQKGMGDAANNYFFYYDGQCPLWKANAIKILKRHDRIREVVLGDGLVNAYRKGLAWRLDRVAANLEAGKVSEEAFQDADLADFKDIDDDLVANVFLGDPIFDHLVNPATRPNGFFQCMSIAAYTVQKVHPQLYTIEKFVDTYQKTMSGNGKPRRRVTERRIREALGGDAAVLIAHARALAEYVRSDPKVHAYLKEAMHRYPTFYKYFYEMTNLGFSNANMEEFRKGKRSLVLPEGFLQNAMFTPFSMTFTVKHFGDATSMGGHNRDYVGDNLGNTKTYSV